MASRKHRPRPATAQLIDISDRRYWEKGAGYRVMNAMLYLGLAREAAERDDFERACRGYRKALETWQSANAFAHNAWEREQNLTNREYAHFLLQGDGGRAYGP